MLSGQNDESNARRARTLGAIDFLAKPCDPGTLIARLKQAIAFSALPDTAQPAQPGNCALIGDSPAIRLLRRQLSQYAESGFPVLIEGESGSGKDIVASCCLHRHTHRQGSPFLAVNCAAIAPSLLEPTLFGHARGAFTGATNARAGYFEEAGDGTLFLDEIGELPADLQPKLLRVLENGEYQRVGETRTHSSKARIVAATNRDLKNEVKAGRFRADLYHRLSVFTVRVPPLREMEGDRERLLDHFRHLYARGAGSPAFFLDDQAMALWIRYPFPGNVRELRNIVIRLTAKFPGAPVGAADLRRELDEDEPEECATGSGSEPTAAIDHDQALRAASLQLQQHGRIDLDNALALWEQSYIEAALELTQGNVSEAARRLGINRTTLYNRMQSRHRP